LHHFLHHFCIRTLATRTLSVLPHDSCWPMRRRSSRRRNAIITPSVVSQGPEAVTL
jgi:hypothetical protein